MARWIKSRPPAPTIFLFKMESDSFEEGATPWYRKPLIITGDYNVAHQEIDFVIQKENNQVLPIEVKTNFQQANHRTMKSFAKKYGVVDWKVVALEGEKKPPHDNYPWEI